MVAIVVIDQEKVLYIRLILIGRATEQPAETRPETAPEQKTAA